MIINGKEAADAAKEDIKRKVETYGVKPTIVVYQVGDNVASNAYVKNKIKACEYCGINCIHKHFDNITQEELISNIEADNNDGPNELNKATYSTDLCNQLLTIYAKILTTVLL